MFVAYLVFDYLLPKLTANGLNIVKSDGNGTYRYMGIWFSW